MLNTLYCVFVLLVYQLAAQCWSASSFQHIQHDDCQKGRGGDFRTI